jgi:hypothetical protein
MPLATHSEAPSASVFLRRAAQVVVVRQGRDADLERSCCRSSAANSDDELVSMRALAVGKAPLSASSLGVRSKMKYLLLCPGRQHGHVLDLHQGR